MFLKYYLLKNQLSFEDITHEENAEQEIANQLGEAKQEIAKQKSKKKKITSILFFALNIVVVIKFITNLNIINYAKTI